MKCNGVLHSRVLKVVFAMAAATAACLPLGSAATAQAAPVEPSVIDSLGIVDRSRWSDVDADVIPDAVEEALCGSATCARPSVDADGDGITDWVEYLACASATCATTLDSDNDCVPDYVSEVLCDADSCSKTALTSDKDGDKVANWIEVVIDGTWWSTSGREDLDGNGRADAAQLAACWARADAGGGAVDDSAPWAIWLGLVFLGLCGLVVAARKRVSR